jgi:hypothetical protein
MLRPVFVHVKMQVLYTLGHLTVRRRPTRRQAFAANIFEHFRLPPTSCAVERFRYALDQHPLTRWCWRQRNPARHRANFNPQQSCQSESEQGAICVVLVLIADRLFTRLISTQRSPTKTRLYSSTIEGGAFSLSLSLLPPVLLTGIAIGAGKSAHL